jgi:hypothetical protein
MGWVGPTPSGLTELQKVLMQGWVEGRLVQVRALLANKRARGNSGGARLGRCSFGRGCGWWRVADRVGSNAAFAARFRSGRSEASLRAGSCFFA